MRSDSAQQIRIGCVPYLNTLPLIEGLEHWKDAALVPAAPSRLVDMLRAKQVDVALASIIDAIDQPDLLALPVGMIGCDGATLTVRLFSRVPFKDITTLHVDAESHTSSALARVILHQSRGTTPAVVEFNAREHLTPNTTHWPEALVLIGDKVVTDAPAPVRYPYQLDLGAAWHEITGLPFVYATWMCLAERYRTDPVRFNTIAATLDHARRRNTARTGWLVSTRAPERNWPRDLAQTYIADYLRFDVDHRARQAAETFAKLARDAGVLPQPPTPPPTAPPTTPAVRWIDTRDAG